MQSSYNLNRTRNMYDLKFLKKYNYLSSNYVDVLPNNIKEVIKWVNFIVANVPEVESALDKMSSIAVTSLNYTGSDLTELNQDDALSWKNIVEYKLKIKNLIKELGYNFLLYANSFTSVNFPIRRGMECQECQAVSFKNEFRNAEIKASLEEAVENNKILFEGVCPKCKKKTKFKPIDTIINEIEKIKIIQWPINKMDIYEDEITGIKNIYYTPDATEKESLLKGVHDKIFHLPTDIIMAALKEGKVKFKENTILHTRNKKLTGTNTSWGKPMLLSAIPDMISLLLLRRSNEKIYNDMIFPFRGVTPRSVGVDENPVYNYINGSDMSKKINNILNAWKKDPTGVRFFPVPIEPITLFGEGKQLDLSQELDSYGTRILTSIGVPPEFIKGGLSYGGAGASLRVLQNQLLELTNSVETTINFIINKVSGFLKKRSVRVDLIPFKLIDDTQDKQNMLGLMQSGKISGHTGLNFFNIDYREEQERMLEEQKNDIKRQQEIQAYQQNIATSLEDKIRQESMTENSSASNLNQTAIIQEADSYAQQMQQLDPNTRKSKMDELAKENPVLYAVVKWRIEFLSQKQATAAKNQVEQQQQQQ